MAKTWDRRVYNPLLTHALPAGSRAVRARRGGTRPARYQARIRQLDSLT
jgi:hypothetical protein